MQERIIRIPSMYQCMHGQEHGYLLAFRKMSVESLSEEAYIYHYAIDVCASYMKMTGDKIQCVFFGAEKSIPFSILVPYDDKVMEYLKENKHKLFRFDVINKPQPFGKGMYRAKPD